MRRLKKKIFLGIFGGTVLLLGAVRLAFPDVAKPIGSDETTTVKSADLTREVAKLNVDSLPTKHVKFEEQSEVADSATQSVSPNPPAKWHPVRSVHSYAACFPDLQENRQNTANITHISFFIHNTSLRLQITIFLHAITRTGLHGIQFPVSHNDGSRILLSQPHQQLA